MQESTRQRFIAFGVMTGTILVTLDSTIANVALPHMQGSLSVSQDQIAWVVTSYLVGMAVSLSLTSFFSARFGLRRMLILAILGFTLMSMLCSLAQTIGEISLFRFFQGVFGAWVMPLSQTLLMATYPRDKQSQILAVYSMGTMIGPIMGPTLGGYLTEHYSWHWVFLINVPVGIVTVLVFLAFMREQERPPAQHFDVMGFGFLSLGIASLQLMLDRGQTLDWFGSKEIVIEAIVAAIALYLFVVHVMTSAKPFLNLRLFGDLNYLLGLALTFFIGAVPMATLVLLPSLLQNVMGYPVQTSGLLMAPRGFGSIISLFFVVQAMRIFGVRTMLACGVACIAATLGFMSSFTTDTRESLILMSGFFQGIGMGFIYMPMNELVFRTMEHSLVTEAAAFSLLLRQIGSSMGVSALITLLSQNSQVVRADLTTYINPFSQPLQQYAAQVVTANGPAALALINREIDRQAAMAAYIDDFRLMTLLSCCVLPLILLFRAAGQAPAAQPAPVVD